MDTSQMGIILSVHWGPLVCQWGLFVSQAIADLSTSLKAPDSFVSEFLSLAPAVIPELVCLLMIGRLWSCVLTLSWASI